MMWTARENKKGWYTFARDQPFNPKNIIPTYHKAK